MQAQAALVRDVDRRERRAVAAGGQTACVAVRQQRAVAQQCGSMLADGAAGGQILAQDRVGFGAHDSPQRGDIRTGVGGDARVNAVERPAQVDGSRSSTCQLLAGGIEIGQQGSALTGGRGARGKVESEGGGDADGRRASDAQARDRLAHLGHRTDNDAPLHDWQ